MDYNGSRLLQIGGSKGNFQTQGSLPVAKHSHLQGQGSVYCLETEHSLTLCCHQIYLNAPGGTTIIAVYMQATNSKGVTTVFIVAQLITLFVSLFNIL